MTKEEEEETRRKQEKKFILKEMDALTISSHEAAYKSLLSTCQLFEEIQVVLVSWYDQQLKPFLTFMKKPGPIYYNENFVFDMIADVRSKDEGKIKDFRNKMNQWLDIIHIAKSRCRAFASGKPENKKESDYYQVAKTSATEDLKRQINRIVGEKNCDWRDKLGTYSPYCCDAVKDGVTKCINFLSNLIIPKDQIPDLSMNFAQFRSNHNSALSMLEERFNQIVTTLDEVEQEMADTEKWLIKTHKDFLEKLKKEPTILNEICSEKHYKVGFNAREALVFNVTVETFEVPLPKKKKQKSLWVECVSHLSMDAEGMAVLTATYSNNISRRSQISTEEVPEGRKLNKLRKTSSVKKHNTTMESTQVSPQTDLEDEADDGSFIDEDNNDPLGRLIADKRTHSDGENEERDKEHEKHVENTEEEEKEEEEEQTFPQNLPHMESAKDEMQVERRNDYYESDDASNNYSAETETETEEDVDKFTKKRKPTSPKARRGKKNKTHHNASSAELEEEEGDDGDDEEEFRDHKSNKKRKTPTKSSQEDQSKNPKKEATKNELAFLYPKDHIYSFFKSKDAQSLNEEEEYEKFKKFLQDIVGKRLIMSLELQRYCREMVSYWHNDLKWPFADIKVKLTKLLIEIGNNLKTNVCTHYADDGNERRKLLRKIGGEIKKIAFEIGGFFVKDFISKELSTIKFFQNILTSNKNKVLLTYEDFKKVCRPETMEELQELLYGADKVQQAVGHEKLKVTTKDAVDFVCVKQICFSRPSKNEAITRDRSSATAEEIADWEKNEEEERKKEETKFTDLLNKFLGIKNPKKKKEEETEEVMEKGNIVSNNSAPHSAVSSNEQQQQSIIPKSPSKKEVIPPLLQHDSSSLSKFTTTKSTNKEEPQPTTKCEIVLNDNKDEAEAEFDDIPTPITPITQEMKQQHHDSDQKSSFITAIKEVSIDTFVSYCNESCVGVNKTNDMAVFCCIPDTSKRTPEFCIEANCMLNLLLNGSLTEKAYKEGFISALKKFTFKVCMRRNANGSQTLPDGFCCVRASWQMYQRTRHYECTRELISLSTLKRFDVNFTDLDNLNEFINEVNDDLSYYRDKIDACKRSGHCPNFDDVSNASFAENIMKYFEANKLTTNPAFYELPKHCWGNGSQLLFLDRYNIPCMVFYDVENRATQRQQRFIRDLMSKTNTTQKWFELSWHSLNDKSSYFYYQEFHEMLSNQVNNAIAHSSAHFKPFELHDPEIEAENFVNAWNNFCEKVYEHFKFTKFSSKKVTATETQSMMTKNTSDLNNNTNITAGKEEQKEDLTDLCQKTSPTTSTFLQKNKKVEDCKAIVQQLKLRTVHSSSTNDDHKLFDDLMKAIDELLVE